MDIKLDPTMAPDTIESLCRLSDYSSEEIGDRRDRRDMAPRVFEALRIALETVDTYAEAHVIRIVNQRVKMALRG